MEGFGRVAICRLSLSVANSFFDNFRQDRVARVAGGIAVDAVGTGEGLFEHRLQAGSGLLAFPNVAPHGFLDLFKFYRASATLPGMGRGWGKHFARWLSISRHCIKQTLPVWLF